MANTDTTLPPDVAEAKDRFWAKVKIGSTDECWPWTASSVGHDGRGLFWFKGSVMSAPRMAAMLNGVELTQDLFVCHSCDNPACCNPRHLWIGSHTDNMRDAARKGRIRMQKHTHCPQGHPLSGPNLGFDYKGRRRCVTCHQENQRASDARRRADGRKKRVAMLKRENDE